MTEGPGPPFTRGVVIVGTGLIGASVGLALRGRGIRVWLSDHDPGTAELAASLGAGDLLAPDAPPPGGPADLAVLAVPPDAVAAVLAAAQKAGLAGCYTDVASVKASPLAAARELGCDLAGYVPGHPVTRLVRTQFGPVRLGRLAPGTTRQLTSSEIGELYAAVDL